MLPPGRRRVIEQANFSYFSLCKAFEKWTKTIEDQGKRANKGTSTAWERTSKT